MFHEQKRPVDKREGAKPIGDHIHRDWWAVFNGGDTEFLLIQAGGFETKKGNTWKSPWFVMKRQ